MDRQHRSLTLAAMLAAGAFGFGTGQFSWAEDNAAKDAGAGAAAAADSAADKAGDAAAKTADAAKDAADNAADATKDAAGVAKDKVQDAQAQQATLPAGVAAKKDAGKEDRDGILKPIATATEAALTKDGFDDLIERIVDQDRNRFGKDGSADKKYDDLNAKAQSLRDAFKAKYGRDFDVGRAEALTHVATLCGEVQDPQQLASAWPVQAVSPAAGEAVQAAAQQQGTSPADKESNIEKGRDVAIATIPASHGLPAVNVSLMQEAGGWKIDLPNNVSGQQLHDNLLKHMTQASDMQAKWPADANAAELAITHHIMLGLYGVDAEPKEGARKGDAGAANDAAAAPAREVKQAD
jgi:hypothetical protein